MTATVQELHDKPSSAAEIHRDRDDLNQCPSHAARQLTGRQFWFDGHCRQSAKCIEDVETLRKQRRSARLENSAPPETVICPPFLDSVTDSLHHR